MPKTIIKTINNFLSATQAVVTNLKLIQDNNNTAYNNANNNTTTTTTTTTNNNNNNDNNNKDLFKKLLSD